MGWCEIFLLCYYGLLLGGLVSVLSNLVDSKKYIVFRVGEPICKIWDLTVTLQILMATSKWQISVGKGNESN